jgi:phosphate transport system substrate-binding protein
MKLLKRVIGLCVLIALVISPALLRAQDGGITVVGSGVVAPVFEALAGASGAAVNATPVVTGTRAGLEQLCAGTADIALATRAILDAEDAACAAAGVEYVEVLLGDFAIALITNPNDTYTDCLSTDNLTTVFAPSAEGVITNWRNLFPDGADGVLTVIVPPNDTVAYALLDSLAQGDGLRADVLTLADDQAIIDAVAATPGALGVVGYITAAAQADRVTALDLSPGQGGCAAPTAQAIANGRYPAAQRLYAYVNRAAFDKPSVPELIDFFVSAPASTVITDWGFLAPSEVEAARNLTIVSGRIVGRQFSAPAFEFIIPQGIVGSISAGGDAAGLDYMRDLTSTFTTTYPGVSSTPTFAGRVEGARRLCNGELDMITLTADLTSEQSANCAANNIVPVMFDIGSEGVVLVANPSSDYLQCLTTQQIAAIWADSPDGSSTRWDAIDPSFPAAEMTLIAPSDGNAATDLMLIRATGLSTPSRDGVVVSNDIFYRAASVDVVPDSLSYMSWEEYQRVLERGTANPQLVAVDGGSGCIVPSLDTISDGSYPLARTLKLAVSQSALRRAEVQSLLWFAFSDQSYGRFSQFGLIGAPFEALPAVRAELQAAFDAAGAAAPPAPTAEPAAEGTPGATPTAGG